eukprot:GHRQ01037580.1.p2 GENE.GHRQ01037580.1~~GHRQ01037580.1.p2  ORF type:complete len:137 (+),score=18.79 GHRQ01037580.1:511-921(+)
MSKSTESVKVVVRCRPLNGKEKQDGRERIVDMDARQGQVAVRNPKSEEPPKTFTFDQVYDWNSEQATIFEITAKPIIDACMDGYNGRSCYRLSGTCQASSGSTVMHPSGLSRQGISRCPSPLLLTTPVSCWCRTVP